MNQAKLSVIGVSVYICSFLISHNALAFGNATRSAINAAGDAEVSTVNDGSIIDLNPNRDVVTTDAGYDSVTSIRVDTSTGVIQGYADYNLPQNQTYPTIEEAGGSTAQGILTLDTFLVGPADPNAPDVVDVTVEMAIHGAFTINNGTPTLGLYGDISATTFNTFLPLNGFNYQALLGFNSTALNTPSDPVTTTFTGVETPLFGGDSMDFAGATADILSSTTDNLDAILRLTFPLALGDSFLLNGLVNGIAGPSPDPGDLDMSDGVSMLAAAGTVDFSNTAELRILLPEGYTLGGTDPLVNNIVHTSVVPVPASIWLMLSGIIALTGIKFTSKS